MQKSLMPKRIYRCISKLNLACFGSFHGTCFSIQLFSKAVGACTCVFDVKCLPVSCFASKGVQKVFL
eukprot:UN23879